MCVCFNFDTQSVGLLDARWGLHCRNIAQMFVGKETSEVSNLQRHAFCTSVITHKSLIRLQSFWYCPRMWQTDGQTERRKDGITAAYIQRVFILCVYYVILLRNTTNKHTIVLLVTRRLCTGSGDMMRLGRFEYSAQTTKSSFLTHVIVTKTIHLETSWIIFYCWL